MCSKNILNLYRKFINLYFQKQNKLELIRFFINNEFFNSKFINRTKKRLVEIISDSIIKLCSEELNVIFREYLQSNCFTSKDAEAFLKVADSSQEKSSIYI